jgi:quercetin dioxygenase-like cupin family protein
MAEAIDELILPGQGDQVTLSGGVGVVFKVPGSLTSGRLAIVEHPVPVDALVVPHTHTKEDELSYVLEGEIGVMIGDREFIAPTGSYVFKPRGIVHAFWNNGTTPARLIELIFPSGLEDGFREMAGLTIDMAMAGQDMKRRSEVSARYGTTPNFDLLQDFAQRHRIPLPHGWHVVDKASSDIASRRAGPLR